MGVELKTDTWHRYMLYRADDYMWGGFFSRDEKQQAVDAGRKFTMAAYPDVWANDAGLVQRVRQFLGANFHWHERLAKSGSDLEVVQTLMSMVRGGSVAVIPEEPQRGGSLGSAAAPASTPGYSVMDPETAEWMQAWVRSIEYPPGEPVLSGPYDPSTRESLLAAARDKQADADTSTPLGDAQPFELGDAAGSGDVQELAATDRGSMYACDVISSECKGSVLREFPGQYLNSTLDDIQSDANDSVKDARKALKLLNDNRFKK